MKLHEQREELDGFRTATDEDLDRKLNDLYRELFNLRMRHVTRQLDNEAEIPRVRKSIARLRTVARERELARMLAAEE